MKKQLLLLLSLIFIMAQINVLLADEDDDLFTIDENKMEQEFAPLNDFEQKYLSTDFTLNSLVDNELEALNKLGLLKQETLEQKGEVFSIFSLFMGPIGVASENLSAGNRGTNNVITALVGVAIVVVAILVLVYAVENPDSEVANTCGNAIGDAIGDACATSCSNNEGCSDGILQLLR